ncbi:MAG: PAS domain S-box protein [Candidatus Methanoperedens sp.]
MKVLVVDDNRLDRLMLSKMLSSNNYEVIEAGNGVEALELISSQKPDMVVSDIMMPVMDGFMLLREIRKSRSPKELPFIFYSASYVTEKDRELANALGVSRFIIKPLEPRELVNEITQALLDISSGKLKIRETAPIKEEEYLERYSRRIFKKLEENIIQLEKEIEERKRIEEELRRSEALFKAIFEEAPIGISSLDTHRRILKTNHILQQMLGFTEEELKGKEFTEFTHPDDSELDMSQFNDLILGKKNQYMIKKRYIRKNKTIFWAKLTVSLVRDAKGDPQFAIRMIEDITERKEAEEKLQNSEEKYRSLIKNIQDGVFIIQDEKFQFVNEAFARLAGYEVEEIIGKDFREFISPEDMAKVFDYYTRRQAGENVPHEYEFNALHRDRKTRLIMNMTVALINYGGRVATMGTLKDITERKRAEELIRQSKEFSETVLNSINDSIIIIDVKNFSIIDTNKSFMKVYGVSKEQAIGKKCHEITHKRKIPCPPDICPLQLTVKTGGPSICEHVHYLNKGIKQFVEVCAYPIKNETGEIDKVVHVARDITERKEAEKLQKEKAKAELHGFIVSALPVFASGVPSHVRDILIKNFSERFEKNVMPRFKDEMLQKEVNHEPAQLLTTYMTWLSGLFSNFGIENRVARDEKKEVLEFINCPWKNEARGNPIFCFICRSLAKRSFTWTGLKGNVEQKSSIANGSKICRFEIQLRNEKIKEK